jgi:hypothetical protein
MPSISIDVLRLILEHVDKADLANICLLNKICCYCSQDFLYRDIRRDGFLSTAKVCQTLAESTHLARRVRSFEITNHDYIEWREWQRWGLQKSLRNMIYLRSLRLFCYTDFSDVDGYTFELVSFASGYFLPGPLLRFLHSQPSLTDVTLGVSASDDPEFGATCLPNLTRVTARFSWLRQLIPNRPVNEVIAYGSMCDSDSADLSFFTLSTAPIRKLTIEYSYLYLTPVPLLASIFPSLTYLKMEIVCEHSFLFM